MIPRWRYIADDGVTAGFGLAADEFMTQQVGRWSSPPVLRLYTYRSHCALVGRFQQVEAEVDRNYCQAAGVAISRRPTGGGAILMGEDQLGVAIAVPADLTSRTYERTRDLLLHFSAGIVRALAGLGVQAAFCRRNDLEVKGKKIAGLGIYLDPGGGLLFHASLLVDLDIPLMLRVLKVPLEKVSDKAIATVAERVTTLRRELGWAISLAEAREKVRQAYQASLGIELKEDRFTDEELKGIQSLEREKYSSPSWIYLPSFARDSVGVGSLKTDAGLVRVSLSLAGEVIKAIYITGDFFVDEEALATVKGSLRWHPAERDAIARTVRDLEAKGVRLAGIPAEALVEAIQRACHGARPETGRAGAGGCFVKI